ncbi:sigma-70 family RNA polymerase sigma factor [Streptomyces sp. SYP-A7185]|uniref:sigma-70 family RNA polymerase sigma factor n=1 Tax=Streptomyces sp. SYP-A7185 TaxID=3040076 RepID=UPI0038F6E259
MAGEEGRHAGSGALTEGQAERMLAGMNDVIRAGEEARKLRAEVIKLLVGLGWTQERIAELADMSQPAVSKQVTKYRGESDRLPPLRLHLGQTDLPWLEGRLWGLAEAVSEALDGDARCTRHVEAVDRGRKRFTPQSVDELRRLVEEDLRRRQAELPGGCRKAYDEISRSLDVPARSGADAASGADAGPPSVRRAVAREIQRDHLEGRC